MTVDLDKRRSGSLPSDVPTAQAAIEYAQQSEKLSHQAVQNQEHPDAVAVEARFVTPHDPIIVTADGSRLPGVPLEEAHKLNVLKEELSHNSLTEQPVEDVDDDTSNDEFTVAPHTNGKAIQRSSGGSLQRTMPPSHTNPLFPPLPLYGPPSTMRNIQCMLFRISSFFLSAAFLGVIVLGALFTSIPLVCSNVWVRMTGRDPDAQRPFYEEEARRNDIQKEQERLWRRRGSQTGATADDEHSRTDDKFFPTEGGPDPGVCDAGYYARRVGLDVEELEVQTEDGFIIDLWHVYDPKSYTKLNDEERSYRQPDLFTGENKTRRKDSEQKPKFPVLLMPGLLQSAGSYCVNDDDSLAFYLCKAGYDVWLGNNRCGFKPKHVLLDYADPRMWCWNIRQMGVFDLPALISRVLYETGFEKTGLICHSQGTTQTLVALAKEQRPDIGEKLTVFCALAPAAYAGPLIGKMYFKFMRVITPAVFRLMFGIHAFIPFMMTMHSVLPARIYGWLGYKVFSFMFDWSDRRWDRRLRDRMFQFAPVYVSSESMRWWLGRECFANHKCILQTREQSRTEEREDGTDGPLASIADHPAESATSEKLQSHHKRKPKGSTAWYNEQVCPFALWVAGKDQLVDGGKLLRRFANGREPHLKVVHSKILPDYEHLDVIWAMDAVDQIFTELRDVLWKTCNVREKCRVPHGCENVPAWVPGEGKSEVESDDWSSDSS
ncbi:hypothetical protein SLS62_002761 [Diatrype stigma]|uniref:Partial AB-hydrolase lipase domain-containing protein n=1 Tax=Diatrype stigma TaxID=117547 RepID=A0AAN9YS00_9PEZI